MNIIISFYKAAEYYVYTDSLCLINTYNQIFNSTLSSRKFLKINNYLIWNAIKIIVKKLSLKIILIKVKAHSDTPLNDEADKLANTGRASKHHILINQKALDIPITFTWDPHNTNIPLDRDIRKAIKLSIASHKSFNDFLSHKPLKKSQRTPFINKSIGNGRRYGSTITSLVDQPVNSIQNLQVGNSKMLPFNYQL
jgi:hypothetical protein